MSENLYIPATNDRESLYQTLIPQIKGLVEGETNFIANLANTAAAIKQTFNFLWVGFYLVEVEELVLGPFQGPIACTRIKKGKGVCGTAWAENKPIIVGNVDDFPGHIACSAQTKSEIVIPMLDNDSKIIGILDIDSDLSDDFNDVDLNNLHEIIKLISLQ